MIHPHDPNWTEKHQQASQPESLFRELGDQKFELIYADPPWAFNSKKSGGSMKSGASQKYKTMGALEKLAICSGGVVFDYLRMLRECCIKAQTRSIDKITKDLALESFTKLVDMYSRIIELKFYNKLVDVSRRKDADVDDFLGILLHMNAILEYNHSARARKWYDVHPGVYRLLIEKGLNPDISV